MLPRLTLVGYRGCGKTTVGCLAATALGWPFVDCDQRIAARAGRAIAEIFARDGEPAFRTLEGAALAAELAGEQALVLSTGGGCVLREENRDLLRGCGGLVAYLEVPVAVLAQRLREDRNLRPSLTGKHPADEVAEVLAQRAPLYRAVAHQTFDGARAPAEIVAELRRHVENFSNKA